MDHRAVEMQLSTVRWDERLGRHSVALQGQGDGHRLHDRARFEHIGDRVIAYCVSCSSGPAVWIEARPVRHREDFTGVRVKNDRRTRPGIRALHGLTQRLEGCILDRLVNRELHVFARRRSPKSERIDDLPSRVSQYAVTSIAARQYTIVDFFDPSRPLPSTPAKPVTCATMLPSG